VSIEDMKSLQRVLLEVIRQSKEMGADEVMIMSESLFKPFGVFNSLVLAGFKIK
jgi:hypothetical protein